ncbi:DUF4625 domain-containing protein [Polaribacter sp.]|uniref:DUF4625 domain-containing protein n=1 Tax=Polaribacter sp. TaxID=1920175 RepID=UPI0035C86373
MKTNLNYFYLLLFTLFISACSGSDSVDIDEEKPTITINYNEGFPKGCTQLKRGETYSFRAKVTDNKALASYSIDIHHNFDHHTHDDQIAECSLEPLKQADSPLIYVENFEIEGEQTNYEINVSIKIPEDIDTGDYHCAYSVTDQTGWQSRTSVDIKIVE